MEVFGLLIAREGLEVLYKLLDGPITDLLVPSLKHIYLLLRLYHVGDIL